MKILASAFACQPEGSAEDRVGWYWVEEHARHHDVWVLTNSDRQAELEAVLERRPLPRVRWIYQDIPSWLRPVTRVETSAYVHYAAWQISARKTAEKLHREVGFDLGHHITFVQYWSPSFLAYMPFPFVWGPVGGGEHAPLSFYPSFGPRGAALDLVRDAVRLAARLRPGVRANARAWMALATTEQTAEEMRRIGARDVRVETAARVSRESFGRLRAIPARAGGPLRIASAGRLLHWKGFHLGILAFARIAKSFPEAEYWIAGDGPERTRLGRLAERAQVAERIRWLGNVSAEGVASLLAETDLLLHPSLHDSGGLICLEAMAAARPVVCLDLGGPGSIVVPETGIAVPARNPSQAAADLAAAIARLADSADLRARMGLAARARVEQEYVWGQGEIADRVIYSRLPANLSVSNPDLRG